MKRQLLSALLACVLAVCWSNALADEAEIPLPSAVTGRIFVTPAELEKLTPVVYTDLDVHVFSSMRYPDAPKVFVWSAQDGQVVAAVEVYTIEKKPPLAEDARFVCAGGNKEFSQGLLYVKTEIAEDVLDAGGSIHTRFYGKDGNDVVLPFRPLLKGASFVGRISAGGVPLDLTQHDLGKIGVITRDADGNKVSEKILTLRPPVVGQGEIVTTKTEQYHPFNVHHSGDILIRAQFDPPLEFREGGEVYYSGSVPSGGRYVEAVGSGSGTVTMGFVTSAQSGVYPIGLETEEMAADPMAGNAVKRIGGWASGPVVTDAAEVVVEGVGAREVIESGVAVNGAPVVPEGRGGSGGKPMLWAIPIAIAAGELAIEKLSVGDKETYVTAVPTRLNPAAIVTATPPKGATVVVAVPKKLRPVPVPMLGVRRPGPDMCDIRLPRIPPIKPSCKYEMDEKPGEEFSQLAPLQQVWVPVGEDKTPSAISWREMLAIHAEKGLEPKAHPKLQPNEAILVDGKEWLCAGTARVTKSADGLVKISLKLKTPTVRIKTPQGQEIPAFAVEKLRYSSSVDDNNWGFSNSRERIILHDAGAKCFSGHSASCTVDVRAKVAISGRATMNALGGPLVSSSGNIQATVQGELWTIGLAPDTSDGKKIDVTQKDGAPPEYKLFAQAGYSEKGPSAQGGAQVTWSPCSSTNLGTGYGSASIYKQATCGVKGTLCYEGIVKVDVVLDDMETEIELFVVPNEFSVQIISQCKHP